MTQQRRLRLAINPELINKNEAGRDVLFVDGFENVEMTLVELADSVIRGVAYVAQFAGRRRTENFQASDIASVDIDSGMTIEEAVARPLVKDHAGMIYTTSSHSADHHRFRVVFVLPGTVVDAGEMRAINRSLALRLGGDVSATDATRIYFGNRGAHVSMIGREVSNELMDELIAQSINPPHADNKRAAAVRSALLIDASQPIRLADGKLLPLSRLSAGIPVHCPMHADHSPSAFVVTSRHRVNGLHCSTCAATFWPASGADAFDFLDFDKAVKRANDHFVKHRSGGQLGQFFDSPAAQPGLLASNITITDGAPAPSELLPGLTLIKSPKGSGKTESLKRLTGSSRRVLFIGHRRSLISQGCKRLELACYLDDEGLSDGEVATRQARYGVCLDSLLRLRPGSRYDVIVLDESEQLLAHFLAATLDNRPGVDRDRLFTEFSAILRRAKRVVALDADLGWLTVDTLTRMMSRVIPDHTQGDLFDLFDKKRPAVRLWLNERKPGVGKTAHLFHSKPHLIADLKQAVADGKRLFVTANSKKLIEKLDAVMGDLPEVRRLSITADTVSGAAQKAFLENPSAEALKYDVILTSPAVGTGVDVTFPGDSQVIDTVYGFCEAGITTHLDFDQQLARVRHPGAVKVWVSPQTFQFETSAEVVKRELLEQGALKNLLVDRNGFNGAARYIDDDPLIGMAALAISQQRASKNALRQNFIAHRRWQGFDVEFVSKKQFMAVAGAATLAAGKNLADENYMEAVLGAPAMRERDFDRISGELQGRRAVSVADRFSLERTKIERFYRAPISKDLIELDGRGRFRHQILLLDMVERAASAAKNRDNLTVLTVRSKFIREPSEVAAAIGRVLNLTPVMREGAWDRDATFDGGELSAFVRYLQANKAAFENFFEKEIRADLANKPVSQLTTVLKLVGLGLKKAGSTKSGGDKTYRYRLDNEALDRAIRIRGARERTMGWQFMAELHKWPDDGDDDSDDEADDGAR